MKAGGATSASSIVRLIATREIRQRLRSRLFVATTLVLSALLLLATVIPLIGGVVQVSTEDPDAPAARVPIAITGGLDAAGSAAVESVVPAAEFVEVDDEASARALVETGDVQLAIVEGERVLERPPESVLALGADRAAALADALALASELEAAGLDVASITQVLDVSRLPIEVVGDFDPNERFAGLLLANLGVVFLLAVLTMYVTMIVNGIIEEKGSRVVELLIEAVPVRQLMAGKVIGLGLVGLGQTVVLFGPAATVVALAGTIALPASGVAPLLVIVGWFLGGYAFYSVVAAAFGALVSRPEEAQAVLTPTSVLMVTGYLVGFFAINAPDGTLATIAGWVPPSAPYVMLVRQLVGSPSLVEVVGSALVLLFSTVVLARLAARIYEGGILRMGARVRLRDAWRAARNERVSRGQ